jgi:MFS family permease
MPLLGGVVIIYLVASVLSGQVTDHGNLRRYATGMLIAYGTAMLVAGLTTNRIALAVIFPFGMFGGAAILMLAYPIMLKATHREHQVAYTAYYQANRGLALLLGTSGAGFAIDTFGRYFPASGGYQAMWLVGAVAAFASLPLYRRLPQTNGRT